MTAKDRPVSKPATDAFRENFDKIFGKKKMNRSDIEMAIVKHLLERAKEFGWVCTKVDNGDGYLLVNDDDEVLDEAFAADSAELCFEREGFRQQWVLFVFGNDGYDVIADHTEPDDEHGGWNQMMGLVNEFAEGFV